MKRSLSIGLVLVPVLILALMAVDRIAVSKEEPPLKVAGVNWPLLFEKAKMVADVEVWAGKQAAEMKTRQGEFKRWVTAKREELELTERGSAQYERLKSEIEQRLWNRKSNDAFVSQQINVRRLEARFELDKKARMVIAKFANENGYNLVHALHVLEIDAKKAKNPEQISAAIASRTTLYWDERVDITDEILAILNAE